MKNTRYLLIIFPYILLLIPGIPYQLGLLLLWLGLAYSTYKWPSFTLIPLSFIISSYTLIRIKDPNAILLAGFRTEIVFIFLSVLLVREFLKKNKFFIPIYKNYCFFAFFLWCLISLIANSNSLIELILAIRENLLVWFLFPLIVCLFKKDNKVISATLIATCLGGALVATFNIIMYYQQLFNLKIIPFSSLCNIIVPFNVRAILGIPIPRMAPLYCIPPGGGAVYNASLSVCSFVCSKYLAKKNLLKKILLISGVILGFAATLNVSISAIGSVFFGIFAVYIRQLRLINTKNAQSKFNRLLFFLGFGVLLFLAFPLELLGIKSYPTIIYYLSQTFLQRGYNEIINYELREIFFGQNVYLATGHLLVQTERASAIVDQWWIMLANRIGFIGLILALMFVTSQLYRYFIVKLPRQVNIDMLCAGSLVFGLLAYIHGCPLIAKPLDYGLMISLAAVSTITRLPKNQPMRTFAKVNHKPFI